MDVFKLAMVVIRTIHRVDCRERDCFRVRHGRSLLGVGRGGGAVCPAEEAPKTRDGAVTPDHLRQLMLRFLIRGTVCHIVFIDVFAAWAIEETGSGIISERSPGCG